MAFGGYKFKGYKVVRANLATNTYANWCLLVHQARIKAFMESCALSGAQWHFSKTNGPLSFEDYGNVIYRVANANGDYHDYLSFFQYGDEELYYMIATLGEYYWTGKGIPVINIYYQYQGGTEGTQLLKYAGYSSALSLQPFDDLGPFGSYPSQALPCTSQLSGTGVNFFANGVKENTSGFIPSVAISFKVGYATKGKDIITICPYNKCCIESGDAFSSLCDPSDTYTLAKIILGYLGDENVYYTSANSVSLDNWSNECLDTSGRRSSRSASTNSGDYNNLAIVPSGISYFTSGGDKIPYSAMYLNTTGSYDNLVSLNEENMFSKGVIKTELLCSNSYYSGTKSNQPTVGSTVMGGNLLVAHGCQSVPSNGGLYRGRLHGGYAIPGTGLTENYDLCFMFPCAYVGWDPSNPNINDESSWQELALQ